MSGELGESAASETYGGVGRQQVSAFVAHGLCILVKFFVQGLEVRDWEILIRYSGRWKAFLKATREGSDSVVPAEVGVRVSSRRMPIS